MEALEACRVLADAEKEDGECPRVHGEVYQHERDEHDGLYWKSMNDVARSPIGLYLAHAGVESDGGSAEPFHGYYYRIAVSSKGFAIVAYPRRRIVRRA